MSRRISLGLESFGKVVWPASLVAGVVLAGLLPSADGDIWWHLAAGREMTERGAFLLADPFSLSAQGRPWLDVHWLFQLVAYRVHDSFGLAGLVWLKCAALAAGACLLLATLTPFRARAFTKPLFVVLIVTALFAARQLLLVRPVIVTLLCLAFFFQQLEQYRVDKRPVRLAALVAAQVIWANCQGLAPLGPAMVAAYALASGLEAWLGRGRYWPFARERTPFKRLAAAMVACGLATAATPFGFRGLLLPAKLLGRLVPGEHNVYAHTVAENVPPYLLERWSGGELWHLKWFLLLLGAALWSSRQRLRASHVSLLAGLTTLALLANRNVLLLYWLATPVAALHLGAAARRWALLGKAWGARPLFVATQALLLAAILGVASVAAARETPLGEPSPFRAPVESVKVLKGLPDQGNVFTADHQGGYLIWQLYPRYRPYIDTRLVLRTSEEFAEYLNLADEPERFPEFQARHRFRYVLLPTTYPDRYLGLIAFLYRSPDWQLIYTDGSEVLFALRTAGISNVVDLDDASTTDRILGDLQARWGQSPKVLQRARMNLATLAIALGLGGQAERVLRAPRSREECALLARGRLLAGDLRGAETLAARTPAGAAGDGQRQELLAQLAFARGNSKQAATHVRRALEADPFDADAQRLLVNLEETRP